MPALPTNSTPKLTREAVLDVRQVAELLRLPLSTALDYARRGILPGHKLGRRWIFLRDELESAVRTAPRSAADAPAQQPPGSRRSAHAKQTLKRYPKAVPRDAPAQQSLLPE